MAKEAEVSVESMVITDPDIERAREAALRTLTGYNESVPTTEVMAEKDNYPDCDEWTAALLEVRAEEAIFMKALICLSVSEERAFEERSFELRRKAQEVRDGKV